MNVRRLHSVLLRPHSRPSACFTRTKPRVVILQGCRNFATHRDPLPSSLLTSALDQKQRGSQRDESVGPFQLGVQPSLRHGEKVKKWSELSTGGKGVYNYHPCHIMLINWPGVIQWREQPLGQLTWLLFCWGLDSLPCWSMHWLRSSSRATPPPSYMAMLVIVSKLRRE